MRQLYNVFQMIVIPRMEVVAPALSSNGKDDFGEHLGQFFFVKRADCPIEDTSYIKLDIVGKDSRKCLLAQIFFELS